MTEQPSDTPASGNASLVVPLDPTGVPGLDEVLGGGIQRGSLAILVGPPAGGKTILAHHIAFSAARTGRRTTILTAFSEPTNKLIAHMRPFAFFDQDLLGQTLDIISIQQFLRNGLDAAHDEIVDAARAARAELVVLDGFRSVRELADYQAQTRRFIYNVGNRLSLLDITLLLTSEADPHDSTFFTEATTADVLLGLAFDTVGARERRTIEVLKVRGAAPLGGLHALDIGDAGVTVYPRIEARVARSASEKEAIGTTRVSTPSVSAAVSRSHARQSANETTIPTGVPGLDEVMRGGLVQGTSTLVVGGRAVGKTLLGLQFALQGTRAQEPSVYVSFRETEEELRYKTAPFSWALDFQRARSEGLLVVVRTPPVEVRVDALAENLFTLIDKAGARRLVFDAIGEIEWALTASGHTKRFHDFIAAIVEALRLRGVTSLITKWQTAERRSVLERRIGGLSTLTPNFLWLRHTQPTRGGGRSLVVLQASRCSPVSGTYSMTIQEPDGLVVQGAINSGNTELPVGILRNASQMPTATIKERRHGDD